MDLGAIIFSIGLLMAGAFLIYTYMSAVKDKAAEEREPRDVSERYDKLRRSNRIKLERGRVWWKVENLHRELLQRTPGAADILCAREALASKSSSSSPVHALVQTEAKEALTATDVSRAFEDFLRQTR